jgi:VWFA-related protein
MRYVSICLTALILLCGPSLPAQQPPVTFKVEVNYVEVDAVVTDAKGNFVRDLTRDEFQILEEGKPQTISVFSKVDIPVERADPPLFAASPIEPDVRSNREEFNGRVFVIVLDDVQVDVRRTPRVKAAVRQFIQRSLGVNDMAAIVQTGGRLSGSQDFTSSRRLLLAALDKFAGQKLPSATLGKIDDYYRNREMRGAGEKPQDPDDMQRGYNARRTLGTLKNVAEYMSGIRGRRKAVVWIGEGIDYDINNVFESRDASTVLEETRDVIAAATRANVSFYGVDPRGLTSGAEEGIEIQALPDDTSLGLGMGSLQDEIRRSQDSLRVISEQTGGFAAVNTNDLRSPFARIIEDNSSYYVLGYYSTDERRDGKYRKLQVRLTRPGLTVRARKGYVAPRGKPDTVSSISSPGLSPDLRSALNSPLPVSGLGLSVAAFPFKSVSGNASVSITLEIDGPKLKFEEKDGAFVDDIEVSVIAMDASGKIKDGGRDLINLRLRPQTHAVVARSGVRLSRRVEVPPGRYQLRIGARESGAGAVGTVLYDLDVPDFSKAPLSMSGVMLTSAAASRLPTANPDPAFKDVLPSAPTTTREFPADDTLAIYAEIYDTQIKTAHRVAINTSVLADDGKVVFTAADERRSEELAAGPAGAGRGAVSKGDGYGYAASIPLKGFAPGRYVLRVEARTLLTNGGTAMRELEFRVR